MADLLGIQLAACEWPDGSDSVVAALDRHAINAGEFCHRSHRPGQVPWGYGAVMVDPGARPAGPCLSYRASGEAEDAPCGGIFGQLTAGYLSLGDHKAKTGGVVG